jgi:hypothetical protein
MSLGRLPVASATARSPTTVYIVDDHPIYDLV